MTRTLAFSSPLLLGLEEFERLLDRVSKTADGYPPYNIERIAGQGETPARIRIILAVAGFDSNEIEVTLEENELSVTGKKTEDGARDYLHRGIAARQFQRTLVLADGMEVIVADLKDGLLSIDLARPEPVRTVRRISITSRG